MLKSHFLASSFFTVVLAGSAIAQTRSSQALILATNLNLTNENRTIAFDTTEGPGDAAISFTRDFTGLDSNGVERTMTFAGDAYAQSDYGRLRASASGTLTGAYYNASENAPFFDGTTVNEEGSPDAFGAVGFAGFTDTVRSITAIRTGYTVRYVFFVDGFNTGTDLAAYIQFRAGSNEREFINIDTNAPRVSQFVTTKSYPITATAIQEFDVVLSAQFNPNTFLETPLLTGDAQYRSTVTLTGIGLYDENDVLVPNFQFTSASGTTYTPVPEPASMAVLGLGLAALKRRRRG